MAFVLEQVLTTPDDAPTGDITTASWTPGANELCLCIIAARTPYTPALVINTITGNGLTYELVASQDDTQGACTIQMWRAMGASPTAGGVTVDWNALPVSAVITLLRFSGVITSGTNGSGAIGASEGADTGATDTANPSTSLVTTANNSRVLGMLCGRSAAHTPGSGFTSIVDDAIANSGGNLARLSVEYKDVATSGTNTTVNFTASANDWAILAVELLLATSTNFNQSVSGSETPTGALLSQAKKALSGSSTPTGALSKSALRSFSGSLTPTGALRKSTPKSFAGSLTPTGDLIKQRVTVLGGSVTLSGALVAHLTKRLTGSETPAGSLHKSTTTHLEGSETPTGALIAGELMNQVVAGSTTPTGALVASVAKQLGGSTTPTGSLVRYTTTHLEGSETPTGALDSSSLTKALSTEVGAYIELGVYINAEVQATLAGAYVELGPPIELRSTEVGAYIELAPPTTLWSTEAGAYIEVGPLTFTRSSMVGVYLEMTPIGELWSTEVGAYIEVQPIYVAPPDMPEAWFSIMVG